ncbi:MAG: EAL domain-containing protein [Candidatus Thiodiazotropha sp.]
MNLSISVKQLLFTLLATALSLLGAGYLVNNSLHDYHRDTAHAEIRTGIDSLSKSIRRIEKKLFMESRSITNEAVVIASLHLINNYQQPDNYNAILFDEEKRKVGERLLAAVMTGEADEGYIYDNAGNLVSFVAGRNGQYTLGIMRYSAGNENISILNGNNVDPYDAQPFEELLGKRSALHAIDFDGIDYHRDDNGLLLEYHQPISRQDLSGVRHQVGTITLINQLDEEFIESVVDQPVAIGILDAHFNPIVAARGNPAPAKLLTDKLNKPNNDKTGFFENKKGFFGVALLPLQNLERTYLISSYPISAYRIASEKTQKAVVMAMLVTALTVIPLSLMLHHRFIRTPMSRLMTGVERLRKGDYGTRLRIDSKDELGQLAAAMNLMIHDIQARENELSSIIDQIPLMLFVKDARHLRFTKINKAGEKLLGRSRHDFIGHNDYDFFPDHQADFFVSKDREVLSNMRILDIPEEHIDTPKGERILHTRKVPIYNDADEPLFLLGVSEDITERIQTETQLRQWAKVIESTNEGVMITDLDGNIINVNRAFTSITGYQRTEIIGQNPRIFKSGLHHAEFYTTMWNSILQNGSWRGEINNRRKNGEIYPAWETISTVHDDKQVASHFVSVFSDISPIKETQEKLDFLAHHDPLTGLPNRILLNDRMQHAINRTNRDQSIMAVMFLDLDRFKNINDTLGHPVGDDLLLEVSKRLRETLREIDTISRQGGDEFLLILEDIRETENLVEMATKILGVFHKPFILTDRELVITASLGISIYPNDAQDVTTLIRNADAAMYRAKENGRNRFWFYTEDLTRQAALRIDIEQALRDTVNHGELFLLYQPQISLAENRIIGVEALIRWDRPGHGIVTPDVFIPLAEETGVIVAIGEWVLNSACRQMAHWQNQGLNLDHIAINISPVQINHGNLVAITQEALEKSGLQPDNLELEVTEAIFLQDTEQVGRTLKSLDSLGVRLALDDFGTGFSSLSYLKDFHFDRLKIDKSFINNIFKESNEQSIANSIIALGHSLNMTVLAEGIEEEPQLQWLKEKGCDEGQGYLFSKPLTTQSLEDLFNDDND